MPVKRALFLDRDGVINYDQGYTSAINDFTFIDGIFELCQAALTSGYIIIVVTNQAGIGRGYFTEVDFITLTQWMKNCFLENGILITDIFYCPFHPEFGVGSYKKDSYDRKPNPGMLLNAMNKHGLNLEKSIMIGDKDSDMQAGSKAGVGERWHYLAGNSSDTISRYATNRLTSLHEAVPMLHDLANLKLK